MPNLFLTSPSTRLRRRRCCTPSARLRGAAGVILHAVFRKFDAQLVQRWLVSKITSTGFPVCVLRSKDYTVSACRTEG